MLWHRVGTLSNAVPDSIIDRQASCRALDAVPHQTLCKLYQVLYFGLFDAKFMAKLQPNAALLATVPENIAEEFARSEDDPTERGRAWMKACVHFFPNDSSGTMATFRRVVGQDQSAATPKPASETPTRDALMAQTRVQLKAKLVDMGLKVSGKKSALVDRLLEAGAPVSAPEADGPPAVAAAAPEDQDTPASPPQVAVAAVGGATEPAGGAAGVEETFKQMTVVQLKDLLRENNCKLSGKKQDLVERCVANGLSAC